MLCCMPLTVVELLVTVAQSNTYIYLKLINVALNHGTVNVCMQQ